MGIADRATKSDLHSSQRDGGRGPPDRRFRELDRRYRPLLHALAVSMNFSPADADDIIQQTLFDLFVAGTVPTQPIGLERLVCALATTMRSRRVGAHQHERLRAALALDTGAAQEETRGDTGWEHPPRLARLRLVGGSRSTRRAA